MLLFCLFLHFISLIIIRHKAQFFSLFSTQICFLWNMIRYQLPSICNKPKTRSPVFQFSWERTWGRLELVYALLEAVFLIPFVMFGQYTAIFIIAVEIPCSSTSKYLSIYWMKELSCDLICRSDLTTFKFHDLCLVRGLIKLFNVWMSCLWCGRH